MDALGLVPDVVFDLDISANRPDALCMAGVARDLAAALGETWSPPAAGAVVPVDASVGTAPIEVAAGDLAPGSPAPSWRGCRTDRRLPGWRAG